MIRQLFFMSFLICITPLCAQFNVGEQAYNHDTWGRYYKEIARGKYPITIENFGLEAGTKKVIDYHGWPEPTSVPQDFTITMEFSKTGKLTERYYESFHIGKEREMYEYDTNDQLIRYVRTGGGDRTVYTYANGMLDRSVSYYVYNNEFLYSNRFIYDRKGDTLTVYEYREDYVRDRGSYPEQVVRQFAFNENDQLVFETSSYDIFNYQLGKRSFIYEYDSTGAIWSKIEKHDSIIYTMVDYRNGLEVESLHKLNYGDSIYSCAFSYEYAKNGEVNYHLRTDTSKSFRHMTPQYFGIPDRNYFRRHITEDKKERKEIKPYVLLNDYSHVRIEYY